MSSIFTKIINGDIPSFKVYEDEKFFAFLDINPLRPGHTLVIPKAEVDYIFDLEDDVITDLILCAKKVAQGLKIASNGTRIGMSVIGLEVPHTHIHLIPIHTVADMTFGGAHMKLSPSEMQGWADKIISAIDTL